MDRPKWVDETIAKAAAEVRTALEEDVIKEPISQLPISFCVNQAKPNDKKQKPVEVVDISDYIKLGITTRKLVNRVNYLSKMMLKLTGGMKMDTAGKDFPRTMADLCANVATPKRPIAQLSLGGLLDFEVTQNVDKKKDNIIVPNNHFVCEMAMKIHELVDEVNEIRAEMKKPEEKLSDHATDHESIDTIMAWQRKTFPKNTCGGQLAKWDEEYDEFKKAVKAGDMEQYASELADMFIVACGIMIFNMEAGCLKVLHCIELRNQYNIFLPYFERALDRKMAKNRRRIWEYKDGNYHHVKGVED